MIRALIADDEASSAHVLRELLEATGRVEVVGEARDGLECLSKCEELEPDALFLDIRMPRASGIEVAEMVLESERPPIIAFITGHDSYAVKAYELAAMDYVVKSFDLDEFQSRLNLTVRRIEDALESRGTAIRELRDRVAALARTLGQMQRSSTQGFRLTVKDYDEGTVRLLDPAEVIYAERRDRRVILCTVEKEYPTYYTIDRLEQRLVPLGFMRANPGVLINLKYIDHLIPNGDGSYDVVLKEPEGTILTASRSRAKSLLDTMQP